mgnify:CR=1 FL=1
MIYRRKLPEYSFFGFKILNSWHSICFSYILLLADFLLTPYFGVDFDQYIAGLGFIIIINISILILIINSFIRIAKIDLFFIILNIPLLIFFSFSVNKLFLSFSYLRFFYN